MTSLPGFFRMPPYRSNLVKEIPTESGEKPMLPQKSGCPGAGFDGSPEIRMNVV